VGQPPADNFYLFNKVLKKSAGHGRDPLRESSTEKKRKLRNKKKLSNLVGLDCFFLGISLTILFFSIKVSCLMEPILQ
jgi:hypothetical protein